MFHRCVMLCEFHNVTVSGNNIVIVMTAGVFCFVFKMRKKESFKGGNVDVKLDSHLIWPCNIYTQNIQSLLPSL